MEEYELRSIHDTRKSFYGKANVRIESNKRILRSYNTDVAYIDLDTNKAIVKGMYSNTTLRHIKEFLLQEGFKADNWKQIEKDYSPSKEQIAKDQEEENKKADSMFKSIGMIAALGDIMTKDKKESNDWKLRMLKAGLENKGLIMPEDWETLSEEEKEARLNNVIAMTKKEICTNGQEN